MPNLSEMLAPSKIAPMVDAYEAPPGDRRGDGLMDQIEKTVGGAIRAHLEGLKQIGVLGPIPNSKGHSSRFLDAWNAMVAGTREFEEMPDECWSAIARPLAVAIAFDALHKCKEHKGTRETATAIAAMRIAVAIKAGEFGPGSVELDTCAQTGERLQFAIGSWQPRMNVWTGKGFAPMQEAAPLGIVEQEIEFKTGNLLISDWFRIEAFTKATELTNPLSINSVLGCETQTRRYLAEHGFISVSVGNTSPDIVRINGALAIGHEVEDDETGETMFESGEMLGSTCTDLWWVTIIEREQLVAIIAKSIGQDAAEKAVESYLDPKSNNIVTQVKVKPGRHRLYFAGDHEKMAREFAARDFPLVGFDPMLVLSDAALELVEKPVPAEDVPHDATASRESGAGVTPSF